MIFRQAGAPRLNKNNGSTLFSNKFIHGGGGVYNWHIACICIDKPNRNPGYHHLKERIMKFQLGQNQLVLELSPSAFAWFHGHTQRMSLTSLSVLFVQFSFFARQPGLI